MDENLVFVTCSGTLLKSTDGGENWNEMGGIFGNDFQFVTDNIGYLTSDDGFFKTENGGETWVEIDSYSFHPFYFFDKNLGFGVYGPLFKTMDGGNTFTQIGGSEIEYDGNIFAVNENIIWGFLPRLLNGDGSTTGIIKVFKDNEGDYIEELWYEDDPTLDMTSIHFADENTGYIVGYKNWKTRIWKNNTGINTLETTEPKIISEIKVYPIPASEKINILFEKPFSGAVSLYDLTGKQVYSSNLIKKNNVHINVEKLAKGAYILLVKEKENIQTRKIIIN